MPDDLALIISFPEVSVFDDILLGNDGAILFPNFIPRHSINPLSILFIFCKSILDSTDIVGFNATINDATLERIIPFL